LPAGENTRKTSSLKVGISICSAKWYAYILYNASCTREKDLKSTGIWYLGIGLANCKTLVAKN